MPDKLSEFLQSLTQSEKTELVDWIDDDLEAAVTEINDLCQQPN